MEGAGAKAQQCHARDLPRSEVLVGETIEAMHAILVRLGVSMHGMKCVELKLLRSPPGAARQVAHKDTPEHAELHAGRQVLPGTKKAPHCVSVLMHINPGTTQGTHMPVGEASQMAALFADLANVCIESNFHSASMQQGDITVFYHDVFHYGPAYDGVEGGDVKDVSTWRWVLFAMFSPEHGAGQDEHQTFVRGCS